MREMGIKAQYVKPYTVTTIDSDFSTELVTVISSLALAAIGFYLR